jgi:WD40 repeat protein
MPDYHKIAKVVIAFLLCIVLSACTGTRVSRETATATPSMPTPAFIASPQPPVSPTVTLRPSNTPTLRRPTNNFRETLRAAFTEQAFVEGTATPTAIFPITCDDFQQDNTYLSHHGNWLAISCGYSRNQRLEIVSKEGKRWMLKLIDFVPTEFIQDGSTGYGALYPEHWTIDEKYLYFASYLGFDGGGACLYGFGDAGLFRINVNDGTISTILPESSWGAGYEITFSPDGRRLAYDYDHLVIIDLKTGEKVTVKTGDEAVGDLTWSPDGSQLAYASCHAIPDDTYPDQYQVEKSSIKIFSLKSQSSKTILEVKKNFLRIERQTGNPLLKIINEDWQANKTDYIIFNWSSEQITTATPTP